MKKKGLVVGLKKCKACGGGVSQQAEKCPGCGQPQTKGSTSVVAALFALVVALMVFNSVQDDNSTNRSAPPVAAVNPPTAPAVVDKGAHWSYSQSTDEMSSQRTLQASTRSVNTVSFKFPYNRPQRATLLIRDHPRHGKDVIFMIERGQILCTSYKDCSVTVRFGENPATTLQAVGPADNSRELIFFRGYQNFIKNMLSVDTVRVSPKIYQEGNPVFTFDVSHFNQSKFRPPE